MRIETDMNMQHINYATKWYQWTGVEMLHSFVGPTSSVTKHHTICESLDVHSGGNFFSLGPWNSSRQFCQAVDWVLARSDPPLELDDRSEDRFRGELSGYRLSGPLDMKYFRHDRDLLELFEERQQIAEQINGQEPFTGRTQALPQRLTDNHHNNTSLPALQTSKVKFGHIVVRSKAQLKA